MQLEIDARVRRLLRLVPLTRVYSVVELVLMALLAWQGARLVWTLVTPVDPVGSWRLPAPSAGAGAGEMLHGFDPFFRLDAAAPAQAQADVVTSLQLTLFGTRINEATGRGGAIIAGPDGEQKSYAVGEEVQPGVTLKEVAFDHVVLTRSGRDETLYLDQSGRTGSPDAMPGPGAQPGATGAPGSPPADGAGVTLAQVRSDVGFIPRIDGGKVTGLVVRPQGSGATFRKIGLKEGDIVTQIGGRPVTGPGDIEALSGQFAKGGSISITVERGAEVLPLVITVSGQ
ncbi:MULTISPECIES: type II secretion system protein N [Sphingomonas]|uniref:type II secretion system protein N n=1 Tax=Sphingomonas TaxID=13687 RepID=UPI0008371197|nr:type II secretion system protein N [Sphingomonas sp. CCH10-B3]